MPGYKLINSLHARILLVICAAAFPLLVGGAYYLYRQTALLQDSARMESTQFLRLAASYAESEVFEAGETLAAISATPAIHDRNWKLCDSYLRRLVAQRSFRYSNIGVIDLDGRVLCSGVTPTSGSLPNLADRRYFQLALEHAGLAVGEYQLGRLTDVPSIAVATALLDENKIPFAVVFASLRLTSLQRVGTKSDAQDSHVTILDRNATILTASDSLIGNVGEQVQAPLLRSTIKSQHQGVQLLTGSQGAFRLVGSALAGPSSDPSAIIVLYTSRGVGTLISLRRDLWLGMLVVFVLMILAIGAGWTGTNALIGRNVRRIAKAAERLPWRQDQARHQRQDLGIAQAFAHLARPTLQSWFFLPESKLTDCNSQALSALLGIPCDNGPEHLGSAFAARASRRVSRWNISSPHIAKNPRARRTAPRGRPVTR